MASINDIADLMEDISIQGPAIIVKGDQLKVDAWAILHPHEDTDADVKKKIVTLSEFQAQQAQAQQTQTDGPAIDLFNVDRFGSVRPWDGYEPTIIVGIGPATSTHINYRCRPVNVAGFRESIHPPETKAIWGKYRELNEIFERWASSTGADEIGHWQRYVEYKDYAADPELRIASKSYNPDDEWAKEEQSNAEIIVEFFKYIYHSHEEYWDLIENLAGNDRLNRYIVTDYYKTILYLNASLIEAIIVDL